MSRILFDLDKTIIDHDTVTRFLLRRIGTNSARLLLALLMIPAIAVLIASKQRTRTSSLLLWIGTVSITRGSFEDAVDRYLDSLDPTARLFPEAVTAVKAHLDQGDEVIVVTASAQQIAERICRTLDSRITVVGSTLERRFGGLVSVEHCYGEHKVSMLKERRLSSGVTRAYSDSASDLPMLQIAEAITGVNMDDITRRKIRGAVGAAAPTEFVEWGKGPNKR